MSTFLTIDDLKQLGAFWTSAQVRVYTELQAAFPDRDPDVAEIINQALATGAFWSETGWRLVRMT